MDIEGYEDKAFEGMNQLLKSNRTILIIVEIHQKGHNPRGNIIKKLKENNFQPEYTTEEGLKGKYIKPINSFSEVPERKSTHLIASKNIQ